MNKKMFPATPLATDIAHDKGHGRGADDATDFVLDITASEAGRILEAQTERDYNYMDDMTPTPLSGEWAGESVPELSALYGIDLEDDELAEAFIDGYVGAWWDVVTAYCKKAVAE